MHSSLPTGDARTLGFDPERLARIGPAMQRFIDARKVPNLVTLVARRGQVVHHDVRGVMDFESGTPVSEGTLFRLYSNTKPMAGVATMILYENGVLTPDDPVTKFVPELEDMRVQRPDAPGITDPVRRDITIRDCLTNTTGMHSLATLPMSYRELYRDTLETLNWVRSDRPALPVNSRERAAALARLPMAGQPGKHFVYHVGFPILGAVLEAAAGESMDKFFREQIFEPLGMDSSFYLAEGALERFPTCYVPAVRDGEVRLTVQEAPESSEKHVGPRVNFGVGGDTGGVLATATDYARFAQMLLNGGELDGRRVLGRKTVEYMCANHTGDLHIPMTGRGFHFGLGVAVYHGHQARPLLRSPGSYGWGGAAGTTYWADPAEELVGVCFTQVMRHNTMPDNDYQETFQRMVYQSLT